jgi:predicted thioredoxin/glutaredoxin
MEVARVKELQSLVSMDPKTVAIAELSDVSVASEQTMRDARQYYPEFIQQVEAEKKKIIGQENTTAIASGGEITTAADKVNTNVEATSYAVSKATATTSATQLLKSIDSILESNDTAKSAQELMGSIEKDMATLKNRLKNLRTEANSAFK